MRDRIKILRAIDEARIIEWITPDGREHIGRVVNASAWRKNSVEVAVTESNWLVSVPVHEASRAYYAQLLAVLAKVETQLESLSTVLDLALYLTEHGR